MRGHVCWRVALTFVAPAAVARRCSGRSANTAVSADALILAFVPVMLVRRCGDVVPRGPASAARWRPGPARTARAGAVVVTGLGVGALTGFFGVGGGFLIVPALTLWLGFGFRRAVATSLVIITLHRLLPRWPATSRSAPRARRRP